MKILIVDDHAVVRRGIIQILADEYSPSTIRETGTGQGAVDAVKKSAWNLVILDLNLPDKPGLEVLKELKRLRPTQPVLILSLHPEEQYAVRAFKAGASGYVPKDSAAEELATAAKQVLAGGKYVTPSFAKRLAEAMSTPLSHALHQTLSDREIEVLQLIGKGRTVTQIADDLSLSDKTVSTYRARLLEKLRLRTTAELIRYALDYKLA